MQRENLWQEPCVWPTLGGIWGFEVDFGGSCHWVLVGASWVHELHDFACSLVSECKQSQLVPSLKTAIFLSWDVLEHQLLPPHLWSEAHTVWSSHSWWDTVSGDGLKTLWKLSNCWKMMYKLLGASHNTWTCVHVPFLPLIWFFWIQDSHVDSVEQEEVAQFAYSMVLDFGWSIKPSSIDFSHSYLLQDTRASTCHWQKSSFNFLQSLWCLVIRFHLSCELNDLNDAMQLLKEALDLLPPPDPKRFC